MPVAASPPDCPLVDTKRLIAWVRENSDELGVDPSQVFLAGCSAGGHLALSAALTPNVAEFQTGFEEAETGVAGVLVCYGYLGSRTSAPSSSPALLAGPDAPPVLIVHGANDTVIPASSAQAVAAVIRRRSGSPVVFVELPQTQHSFDRFASVRSRMVAAGAGGIPRLGPARPRGGSPRRAPVALTSHPPPLRIDMVTPSAPPDTFRR